MATYGMTNEGKEKPMGVLDMTREAIERAEILCKTVDELHKQLENYLPPDEPSDVVGIETPPNRSRSEAIIELARLTELINRAISELCYISDRVQL